MADTDQTKQPNGVQAAYSIADKLTPEQVKDSYLASLSQARVLAKKTASLALTKVKDIDVNTIGAIIEATEQSSRYGILVTEFSAEIKPIFEEMQKAYAKIDQLENKVKSIYAIEIDQKAREGELAALKAELDTRAVQIKNTEYGLKMSLLGTVESIEHETKSRAQGHDTTQLTEMAKQLTTEEARLYKLRQELDKREHTVRDGVARAKQYVADIKNYIAEKHNEIVTEREEVLEQRLAQKQELQDIAAQGKVLLNEYINAAITRAGSVQGGETLKQELLASQPDIAKEITKLFAVGTIKLTQLGDVAPVETTRYKNLTTQLDEVHNFLINNTDNPTLLEMSPPVEKKPEQAVAPAPAPAQKPAKKINPNDTVIFTPLDESAPKVPPQNP